MMRYKGRAQGLVIRGGKMSLRENHPGLSGHPSPEGNCAPRGFWRTAKGAPHSFLSQPS